MRYLKTYESNSEMYQAFYVTPFYGSMPGAFIGDDHDKINIKQRRELFNNTLYNIVDDINNKYGDSLTVKMSRKPMTGVILKGDVYPIAQEVYDMFTNKGFKVRVVYGKGTMDRFDYSDINMCWGNVLIKIGRYMDSLINKSGIYEV